MSVFRSVLAMEILGNPVVSYLVAIGIFAVAVVVFQLLQRVVLRRAEVFAQKTKTDLDDAFVTMVRVIKPPFYWFVAFYIALQYLDFRGIGQRAITLLLVVWIVYQIIRALQIFIGYLVQKRLDRDDPETKAVGQLITTFSGVVLWALGGLFVLSNFGVNVNSLIAGLGVGGIAVALAAQNVLGDIFSSLALYFDKPFAPGDFIVVGDHKGTIQHVGIRTTRIKSLGGEELVIPNKELAETRVSNYRKMHERRVVLQFGVVYETSQGAMKKIPDLVRGIIESTEGVRFDRVHFCSFDDSALSFEAVFYVLSPEYNTYMDRQQRILLGVKEAFEHEKISMAYPTRTVYLQQS